MQAGDFVEFVGIAPDGPPRDHLIPGRCYEVDHLDPYSTVARLITDAGNLWWVRVSEVQELEVTADASGS